MRRMALALEQQGDSRAAELLLDAWVPNATQRCSKMDTTPAEVETALRHALLRFVTQTELPIYSEQRMRLRAKLDAVFGTDGSRNGIVTDFSNPCADILVTLMQLLSRSTHKADLDIVARIANCSARLPNAVFVREAARECLAEANRARDAQRTAHLTQKNAHLFVVPPLTAVYSSTSTPAPQTVSVHRNGGTP